MTSAPRGPRNQSPLALTGSGPDRRFQNQLQEKDGHETVPQPHAFGRRCGGAAQQPFEARVDVHLAAGENVASSLLATVPIGKRLIIETISLNGFVPGGQKLEDTILTANCTDGVTKCVWSMLPTDEGVWSGLELFGAFQQGRIYVEPGQDIVAGASRSDTAGEGNATIQISGYLVNVPA